MRLTNPLVFFLLRTDPKRTTQLLCDLFFSTCLLSPHHLISLVLQKSFVFLDSRQGDACEKEKGLVSAHATTLLSPFPLYPSLFSFVMSI